MELKLEHPGDHLFIRSVSQEGITVRDTLFSGPVLLTAERLVDDWQIRDAEELDARAVERIMELEPEVVLIGTGASQVFLPPEIMMEFYSRGVGAEVMATSQACYTFNVLTSENRRVAAALMPLTL